MKSFQEFLKRLHVFQHVSCKKPMNFNFYSLLSNYMHTHHFLNLLAKTYQPKLIHSLKSSQVWSEQYLCPHCGPHTKTSHLLVRSFIYLPLYLTNIIICYMYQDMEKAGKYWLKLILTTVLLT